MNKKQMLKKTAAIFLALGLTVGATGCQFLVTDSMKDLEQIVATVDISEKLASDTEYQNYADEVSTLISEGKLSADIPKRDLVAYFLNVGYNYVNNYGYSYEDTFNMLMDGLTQRKILTQYAVAYFLKKGAESTDSITSFETFKTNELNGVSDRVKELYEAYPEVLTMKYYLTDFGKTDAESMKAYYEAEYGLLKSLNDSLDAGEANFISEEDETHSHGESRTTPTNVGTEKEDYLPMKDGKLDYGVYTGRNTLDSCGAYEKVDGSTPTTRKKAYNTFLANIEGYGLIKDGENTAAVTELEYYYMELSSTLGQALVTKYQDEMKDAAIARMTDADVLAKYNELKEGQQLAYTDDYTVFDTALDSVSDDKFILYGLQDFGFVYNILIPFSDAQNQEYSAAEKKGLSEAGLFEVRKDILAKVEAKDLRSAWICTDEHTNYGYEVTATADGDFYGATANAKGWLFFEDNFTNTEKYETLTQYTGKYPYQGTVALVDDEYKTTPTKLSINEFITEMENYINYSVGSSVASGAYATKYDDDTPYSVNNVVDYSKFIYYEGKVGDLSTTAKASEYFKKDTTAYKALSAVNELMFAYSTDTGCLNTYMGYAVSPYKTDFVPEFEYAAQYAVKKGVGTYVVAPSQYGWHIIYCTYKFDGGEVFGDDANAEDGFIASEKETEGTFSYLFYESLKSTSATNHANAMQNTVLNDYKDSVELFTKRYQDLLDIEN